MKKHFLVTKKIPVDLTDWKYLFLQGDILKVEPSELFLCSYNIEAE